MRCMPKLVGKASDVCWFVDIVAERELAYPKACSHGALAGLCQDS